MWRSLCVRYRRLGELSGETSADVGKGAYNERREPGWGATLAVDGMRASEEGAGETRTASEEGVGETRTASKEGVGERDSKIKRDVLGLLLLECVSPDQSSPIC